MDTLNQQQKRAVEATDGPVVIVAGPGTGKTKTLTARILFLIDSGRARPQDILALTFTRKAAEEMAARVGRDGPTICTFHALCSSLLPDGLVFVTEAERLAIIKSVPKPSELKGVTVRELGLRISRAKNLAEQSPALDTLVTSYNQALEAAGRVDFDDLLMKVRDLLKAQPHRRPTFTHILVDEFQDTNLLQYELLALLRSNDNLFIIGDPNQSIYGFRGADGNIFTAFLQDFPAAEQITLTANYRSASPVVALGNAVFADAPQLSAQSSVVGSVKATEFLNEYSEAHWVISEIQNQIGGADLLQATHNDARSSLRDFAILYRSRHAAITMQKYIAESGLPYQVVGDGSPYDRPEVQTLIALFKCCAGQDTGVPGFTRGQVATLLQKVDTQAKPVDMAYQLMHEFGITVSPDLAQVASTLVRFSDLTTVVAHFDSLAAGQFYDPGAEAITLLTIHASKGLEFQHVFLIGTEEGILPGEKANEQEERRLFYVAVTRAKEHLNITSAARRAGKSAKVSRFVTELPGSVLPQGQDLNMAADRLRLQKRQAKRSQTSLF
ncbi:MAG TPA: ATP-dependent helicase [Candidatus Saccharimonadales bacterium]|nr:ATP-dependent helicase [Candidatus Saccharimonadales bacterium]